MHYVIVKPLQFLTFLIFTAVVLISIFANQPYLTHIFVFLIVPIVDYWVGENELNPNSENEIKWKNLKVWAPILYLYILTHFALLYVSFKKIESLSLAENILLATAVGLYTGGLGITVAHELCHKKEKINRALADLILASVCYTHFAIEHVRGHHLNVSTPRDPASALKGESAYAFLPRTIFGSFKSAWSIDAKRVLRGLLLSILFGVGVYILADVAGVLFFLVQSFVAIVLLELVNYVEHYGLSRKQLDNGRYEIVRPEHSWNSSHLFSNLLLFNLQRHSDHHAAAHLPYTVLKHQEKAPQLPSGYPGMILLALIPPAWFHYMNSKLH